MRKAIICIFWRPRVQTSGSAWQTAAISRPQLGEAPLGCRHQLDEERRLHNPQKSVERIRERSGVEFQIRDIRPTLTTGVAEDLGITSFIIAKAMDHKLPGEAEMGEVYNRYDYPGDPDKPHAARAVRRMCRTAVLVGGAEDDEETGGHGCRRSQPKWLLLGDRECMFARAAPGSRWRCLPLVLY